MAGGGAGQFGRPQLCQNDVVVPAAKLGGDKRTSASNQAHPPQTEGKDNFEKGKDENKQKPDSKKPADTEKQAKDKHDAKKTGKKVSSEGGRQQSLAPPKDDKVMNAQGSPMSLSRRMSRRASQNIQARGSRSKNSKHVLVSKIKTSKGGGPQHRDSNVTVSFKAGIEVKEFETEEKKKKKPTSDISLSTIDDHEVTKHVQAIRARDTRKMVFKECMLILDMLMERYQALYLLKNGQKKPAPSRLCDGASKSGFCGGYTPGGWNMLQAMGFVSQVELRSRPAMDLDHMQPELGRLDRCPAGGVGAVQLGTARRGGVEKTPSLPNITRGNLYSANYRKDEQKSDQISMPGAYFRVQNKQDTWLKKTWDQGKGRVGATLTHGVSATEELGPPGSNVTGQRILGEVAFQLERRMLDLVLGRPTHGKRFMYGDTVAAIFATLDKHKEAGADKHHARVCRMKRLLQALSKFGYDFKTHSTKTMDLINSYGILPEELPHEVVLELGLEKPCCLEKYIRVFTKAPSEQGLMKVLFNCLSFLAKADGEPLLKYL